MITDFKLFLLENKNVASDYVYYALSCEEILNNTLYYNKSKNYNTKLVNLDLFNLKRFIKDNFNSDYFTFYYIKIPITFFNINNNIYIDNYYNMIAVELPLKINLTKFEIFPLFPDIFLQKIKYLYHITKKYNKNDIINNGLIIGKESSNYGVKPLNMGIYLYHKNNIDVEYDMRSIFPNDELIKIKIDITKLKFGKFIADEDFYKYNKQKINYPSNKYEYSLGFMESLNNFGLCCYVDNISNEHIKNITNIS